MIPADCSRINLTSCMYIFPISASENLTVPRTAAFSSRRVFYARTKKNIYLYGWKCLTAFPNSQKDSQTRASRSTVRYRGLFARFWK